MNIQVTAFTESKKFYYTSYTSTFYKISSVGKEMVHVNRIFALGRQLHENRFSPGIVCINI